MTDIIFEKMKLFEIKPKISEKEFLKKILLQIANDENTPVDIFDLKFDKVKLEYNRYIFLVEETIQSSYKGSIGYDREETYWAEEKKYDNGNSYIEYVLKKKIVTDWKPYEGEDIQTAYAYIDDLRAARYDICHKNNMIEGAVEARMEGEMYAKNILTQIDKNELELEEVEVKCNTGTKSIWATTISVCEKLLKLDIFSYYQKNLPGDRKKLNYTHKTLEVKKFLCYKVPEYSVKYTYKDKEYKCWMDAIPLSDIYCEAPRIDNLETSSFRTSVDPELIKETEKQTANKLSLMKISWALAFGGLLLSFILCIVNFYFGWIVAGILIAFAIFNHIDYDKKFYSTYKKLLENKEIEKSNEKIKSLPQVLERNGLEELNSEEKDRLNSYIKDTEYRLSFFNPRGNSKAKLISTITIVALAVLLIFSLASFKKYRYNYNYSPERISIEWVDKQKVNNYGLNLIFEIESEKLDVKSLKFELIIYKKGEKLGSLTSEYKNAKLKVSEVQTVVLTWNSNGMDSFFNTVKESGMTELTYEIKIKEIWFGDYEHYELEE